MNILSRIIIVTLLLAQFHSFSQNVPVELSKTIEVVDGQKYYVHVVKKGETVYSLCKAYNVTEQELKSANPGALASGITNGQKLLFPYNTTPVTSKKTHVVQKGETLYGISKQYDIGVGELVQANPEARSGVSPGQELVIPASTATAGTKPTSTMQPEKKTAALVAPQTHTVVAGETVYSISKQYGIDQETLAKQNPDITDGLKVGQVLSINGQSQTQPATPAEPRIHTVVQGETVYSIARMYNVQPNAILEANPAVQSGLSPGMKIRLPEPQGGSATQAAAGPVAETPKKNVTIVKHTIEAGETLYSIARLNGCTTKDIEDYNPGLNFSHIAVGTIIQVPSTLAKPQQTVADTSQLQSLPASFKSKSFCDSIAIINKNRAANVVYLLPFHLRSNDSLNAVDINLKRDGRLFGKSVPFVEFYEGSLLAMDSLKKMGVSVNIKTYDSDEDSLSIELLLLKLKASNVDLIIGPPAQERFEKVARFAQDRGIPIVSPLSTNTLLASTYNTTILANTPQKCRIQAEALFSMTDKTDIINYVIVFNGHVNEYDNIDKIKQHMLPFFKSEEEMNTRVKVVKWGLNAMQHIEDALVDTGKNVVIIPSEDQAFVNDIVTRLYRFSKKYVIELHGMAVWETYKNIELDYLFDYSFHFVSSNFRDYTSPRVKSFVERYRNSFNTEPSKLSFQGYDITYYFVNQAAKYGKSLQGCIMGEDYHGLQTSFTFEQLFSGSGLVNTFVNVIGYTPDYKREVAPFDFHARLKQYDGLMKSKGLQQHIDARQEQPGEEQE